MARVDGFVDYDSGDRAVCAARHRRSGARLRRCCTRRGRRADRRASIGASSRSCARAAQTAAAWNLETDVCLCTGPAYHAAPLAFNVAAPLNAGVGVVLDGQVGRGRDAAADRAAPRHAHAHGRDDVPPPVAVAGRACGTRYDLSSLRFLLHGAAPTPVHEKRAMIDWLGPIVYEYYAATEGGGSYFVTPEEWLRKPGSVGKFADSGAHPDSRRRRQRRAAGADRHAVFQSAGDRPLRVLQGAGEDRRRAIAATGSRSATWVISTTTAICS